MHKKSEGKAVGQIMKTWVSSSYCHMRDKIFVFFSFFHQEVLGSGRLIPVSILLTYKTFSLEQEL